MANNVSSTAEPGVFSTLISLVSSCLDCASETELDKDQALHTGINGALLLQLDSPKPHLELRSLRRQQQPVQAPGFFSLRLAWHIDTYRDGAPQVNGCSEYLPCTMNSTNRQQ